MVSLHVKLWRVTIAGSGGWWGIKRERRMFLMMYPSEELERWRGKGLVSQCEPSSQLLHSSELQYSWLITSSPVHLLASSSPHSSGWGEWDQGFFSLSGSLWALRKTAERRESSQLKAGLGRTPNVALVSSHLSFIAFLHSPVCLLSSFYRLNCVPLKFICWSPLSTSKCDYI